VVGFQGYTGLFWPVRELSMTTTFLASRVCWIVFVCLLSIGSAVAQPRAPKPAIVKTVSGTITEIIHPRAGTSVIMRGTDGITYQFGVDEGDIVGATVETLKVGDQITVGFSNLTKDYPPTYGNPVRTTVSRSASGTPPAASSSSGLNRENVQRALEQLLAGVRRGGSATVQGIQNTPDGADVDVRFDGFQYYFNSAAFMGVQHFAGMGKAVVAHYNDGRWVLTRVVWNFGDYVSGQVEVARDSTISRVVQSVTQRAGSPTKEKVQPAVNQLLNGVRRGGTAIVQGVREINGGAEVDISFATFQYYFSSAPFMGVQQFSGMGTGTLAHYNDGRWVLTKITWNFGDYVTGNVEVR
jgi:hypothetical protein